MIDVSLPALRAYAFEGNFGLEREALRVCEAENAGVRWFSPEEALAASTEPWFVERIYAKFI